MHQSSQLEDSRTDRYAVFGHPVAHSKSPLIHATFGRQEGISIDYRAIDLAPDAFLAGLEQHGCLRPDWGWNPLHLTLWDGDALVPVAKAYSGLDDKEILALDHWIRAHTRERFGPVRSVVAEQVFELGWEEARADGVALIEWAERLGSLLPQERLTVTLSIEGEGRRATLEGEARLVEI